MLVEIQDSLGSAQINVKTKPVDENQANAIYLAVFDNGPEAKNSCRFKVSMNFVFDDGTRKEFIAPILNHFEPARWLRSVPEEHREKPFYRQALEIRAHLKKTKTEKFQKDFSCGFFYDVELGHEHPMNGAYAYFVKTDEHEDPVVGFRFFDYVGDFENVPENEYHKGRGPKWNRVLLKADKEKGMIDAW